MRGQSSTCRVAWFTRRVERHVAATRPYTGFPSLFMELAFGILALIGIGVLIALQLKKKTAEGINPADYERLKAELDRKSNETGELRAQLAQTQSEKDEMGGKNKAMFAELTNVKAELKAFAYERDQLIKQVKTFEEQQTRREREHEVKFNELVKLQESFEKERARVIREDEEKRARELEERDRMWADHENTVVAALSDLCKQPTFNFTAFSNTNLPDGFDGSLKPDFMIDFLGQYVIFDAKVSKAKSLQTYVNDQVKKTVEKVKSNDRIYRSIFLVVPATALSELKSHHYTVDGYQLFVVSPEALPPILAAFKRISMYEFAEQMDPQQRENIVQMVAELDFHINLRNAADIFLSSLGSEILEKARKVDPALAAEVDMKKAPMNAKASIAAADIKKLVVSIATQKEHIGRLVSPKEAVASQKVEEAKKLLSDSLF